MGFFLPLSVSYAINSFKLKRSEIRIEFRSIFTRQSDIRLFLLNSVGETPYSFLKLLSSEFAVSNPD